MKLAILFTGFIIFVALFCILTSCKGQSSKTIDNHQISDTGKIRTHVLNKNAYEGLRQMAFGVNIEQLGLSNLKTGDIYGVIMDWDLGEGVMTLVTYTTGDASMYLSTGGGVIGGGKHDNVSKASKQFVKLAERYLNMTVKTDLTSIPDKNCVRFYFLTNNGKYYAQEQMLNFENKTSKWLDYFEEANKVITELRLTTGKN